MTALPLLLALALGAPRLTFPGGGTPGGANTEVQFNNSGAFGGDAGLTYNLLTDTLTLNGPLVSTAPVNAEAIDLRGGDSGTSRGSYLRWVHYGLGGAPGNVTLLYSNAPGWLHDLADSGAFGGESLDGGVRAVLDWDDIGNPLLDRANLVLVTDGASLTLNNLGEVYPNTANLQVPKLSLYNSSGLPGTSVLDVDNGGTNNSTINNPNGNLTLSATGGTASLLGNASTSTALAADPTDCTTGQYATAIAASGNLTCAQVAYSQLSGAPSIAPTNATYITQTPDATLSAEQAISALSTGILGGTTTTGVISTVGTFGVLPATYGNGYTFTSSRLRADGFNWNAAQGPGGAFFVYDQYGTSSIIMSGQTSQGTGGNIGGLAYFIANGSGDAVPSILPPSPTGVGTFPHRWLRTGEGTVNAQRYPSWEYVDTRDINATGWSSSSTLFLAADGVWRAPGYPSNQGTTTTVLHGNASGAPSFSAVSLTADVSGTLAIGNGGTNGTATPTAGAVAYGSGTAYAFSAAGNAGDCLKSGGTGTPTWGSCSAGGGYATIQDETTPLTQRTTVNFTGAGVTCVDNAGATRTDCTISGGGTGSVDLRGLATVFGGF